MKTSLTIKRGSAYALSSTIIAFAFIITDFYYELFLFSISVFISIYALAQYFDAKYNSSQLVFKESLLLTIFSYNIGILVITIPFLDSTGFILLLIYGNLSCVIIGAILGLINTSINFFYK